MTANPKINKLNRYIFEAKKAGVPKDTLLRFFNANYVPQMKQLQFHAKARMADFPGMPNELGFGGARGGGKTACVFSQIAIDDCQRFDNLKVLFLRESAGSATESVNDLRLKFLQNVEHKPTRNVLTYPNNSRIILGHFQYEKDINKYLGLEYDIICLEEATQLSATKIKDIRTCNRSSKGFRPRMYLTTNPGGIGHTWFKKDFIQPHRQGKETDTAFIFSLESDNKHNDGDYRSKLEKLTGWKRKAWLEGDWDILAGQFFENFRFDIHVIKPFNIPKTADFWGAFDYGFNHPTVFQLLAKYDGVIYIVAEFRQRKQLPKTIAPEIKSLIESFGLSPAKLQIVAGHDVFANKGDENAKTIADQYREEGLIFERANIDRINGAGELLQLLGDDENGIEPKLYIFNTCGNLIEQIPAMQHDPSRPDDVLKVDIDDDGNGGDDSYDCFVAGTPITTINGQVPIEKIKEGDLVLTREGYKPVMFAWKTHKNARVLTARFSNGTSLTATPNHPFWVKNKGFVRLDALRYGDIIETVWKNIYQANPKQLFSTEYHSDDTQIQNTATIETTIHQAENTLSKVLKTCTLKSGNPFTAKCLMDITSITKTATRLITRLIIWSVFHAKSILQFTQKNPALEVQSLGKTQRNSRQFKNYLPTGINQKKVESGTSNTAKTFSVTDPKLKNFVSNAMKGISQVIRTYPAFVQTNANQNIAAITSPILFKSNAKDVVKNLVQTNTTGLGFVQSSVPHAQLLSLVESGNADTYTLSVTDCHEYYAGGILVKNCARYGVMRKPAIVPDYPGSYQEETYW